MNLLLFNDDDLIEPGVIAVRDRRYQHIRTVLQSQAGDVLRVGHIGGLVGEGEITELHDDRAVLQVSLQRPPPRKLNTTLVVALPRPKMLRRILRMTAEFGVSDLHLINSYRVEKSYWQTPALVPATVREYLLQGLEQAGDTVLPQVHCHQRFKPFVEDEFPNLAEHREAYLAHAADDPAIATAASALSNIERASIIVIGPEGGFIPYEIEKLQESGCSSITLGPRVLRVENAVAAFLGLLST